MAEAEFPTADQLVAEMSLLLKRVGTLTATVDQLQAEHDRNEQALRLLIIAVALTIAVGFLHTYQLFRLASDAAASG